MNRDTTSSRFREASQEGARAQGAHTVRDKHYLVMSDCHAATIRLLEQIQQAWQPVIQAYNQNSQSASLRSQITSSINPGHFLETTENTDKKSSTPSITLRDMANGSHVMRVAFRRIPADTQHELLPAGVPSQPLGNRSTGYILPGTNYKVTAGTLPPWTEEMLDRLTSQCASSLQDYLEQRGHA